MMNPSQLIVSSTKTYFICKTIAEDELFIELIISSKHLG